MVTIDHQHVTVATAFVLMMTIPGLALFYSGMVRKKNVLATMAQSLAATFLVSILWAIAGYSLAINIFGINDTYRIERVASSWDGGRGCFVHVCEFATKRRDLISLMLNKW